MHNLYGCDCFSVSHLDAIHAENFKLKMNVNAKERMHLPLAVASRLLLATEPVHSGALHATADIMMYLHDANMPPEWKHACVDLITQIASAGDSIGHSLILLYFEVMHNLM